eukprot:Cvel_19232.t1-p1 / transcript=Cvel_19232.t1 / gene=Cvel_19232 / organism=Chromera_velia_CCMP2878 / gene_product=hypothetical protein / transcript_product=hypothetical protein / location=Cvel_scaffold1644:21331-25116(+) / protein_length=439 / sequence_SO=supercontig / SO=protein_coding / is_pseudo=false
MRGTSVTIAFWGLKLLPLLLLAVFVLPVSSLSQSEREALSLHRQLRQKETEGHLIMRFRERRGQKEEDEQEEVMKEGGQTENFRRGVVEEEEGEEFLRVYGEGIALTLEAFEKVPPDEKEKALSMLWRDGMEASPRERERRHSEPILDTQNLQKELNLFLSRLHMFVFIPPIRKEVLWELELRERQHIMAVEFVATLIAETCLWGSTEEDCDPEKTWRVAMEAMEYHGKGGRGGGGLREFYQDVVDDAKKEVSLVLLSRLRGGKVKGEEGDENEGIRRRTRIEASPSDLLDPSGSSEFSKTARAAEKACRHINRWRGGCKFEYWSRFVTEAAEEWGRFYPFLDSAVAEASEKEGGYFQLVRKGISTWTGDPSCCQEAGKGFKEAQESFVKAFEYRREWQVCPVPFIYASLAEDPTLDSILDGSIREKYEASLKILQSTC